MTKMELNITGIEIDGMATAPLPPHHQARVRFRYDMGGAGGTLTANLLCRSTLTPDATPDSVRDDLVRHGLGQLRRMPEIWLHRAEIRVGTDAVVDRAYDIAS